MGRERGTESGTREEERAAEMALGMQTDKGIPTPPQVLGSRRGDVDVLLNLTGVSGTHCRLEIVRGGVKVTDLGSTNGTTIDGREVGSCVLSSR